MSTEIGLCLDISDDQFISVVSDDVQPPFEELLARNWTREVKLTPRDRDGQRSAPEETSLT